MGSVKVGVQLCQQHTSVEALRAAWREADRVGVDSIWLWDHFFPIAGDPQGSHFEGWTLLAAMAVDTERARVGVLVSGNGYRNPDLLADMARTVDHLSGGRAVLGIGAGWARRDYQEYGFAYPGRGDRLRELESSLVRIKRRLAMLEPGPQGRLPLLVGGGGEKVTLRLVAEHADAWNVPARPERFAEKNRILDQWCHKVGRDPGQIERSVVVDRSSPVAGYLDAGAQHLIVGVRHPFDLTGIVALQKFVAGYRAPDRA